MEAELLETAEGVDMYYKMIDDIFGRFLRTGTRMTAHKMDREYPERYYYRAITVCHPSYLPCIGYDWRKKRLIHHVYDESLRQRLEGLKMRQIEPVKKCKIVADRRNRTIEHACVSEEYQLMLRSLYKFVYDQHEQGYTLTKFGADNIVFVGDELKFVGIGFIKAKEDAVGRTQDKRRANFDCIAKIRRKLFEGYAHKLTRELSDLVDMEVKLKCESSREGFLLVNHPSLMSPRQLLNFIIALHERVKTLKLNEEMEYRLAIGFGDKETGRRSPYEDWDRAFLRNAGLGYVYDFFTKPRPPTMKVGTYTFSGDPYDVNRDLIRACRNLAIHLSEYGPYEDKDVAWTIMHLWGDFICSVQRRLERHWLLHYFLDI